MFYVYPVEGNLPQHLDEENETKNYETANNEFFKDYNLIFTTMLNLSSEWQWGFWQLMFRQIFFFD